MNIESSGNYELSGEMEESGKMEESGEMEESRLTEPSGSIESSGSLREKILNYAELEYQTKPEYLWHSYPLYAVLRHSPSQSITKAQEKSGKWYAVLMDVRRETLGLQGDGFADILDVKLDPDMVSMLAGQKGYRPAYHMNKTSWITVLLDGSVPVETIFSLLDQSYAITCDKEEKKKLKNIGPKYWIIPANPKYYDVVGAFQKNKIIDWKQSSAVQVGDIIYMYVAAPYSAILYKCRAVEVDIPYPHDHHLNIKKIMRIEQLETYDSSYMTFDRLKKDFEVYAVRGPRSAPLALQQELGE